MRRRPPPLLCLIASVLAVLAACGQAAGLSPAPGPGTAPPRAPASPANSPAAVAAAPSPAPQRSTASSIPPTPTASPPAPTATVAAATTPTLKPVASSTLVLATVEPSTRTPASTAVAVSPSPASPVDAELARLSPDDRLGQMLMLALVGPDARGADVAIQELRAGSIVLIGNATAAADAASLTAGLQRTASAAGLPPLLISIDQEGGRVQRLKQGVTQYGPAFDVGRVQPDSAALAAVCERGVTQGRELQALGINVNLAPVLDVWDNPANTVIGDRSFSADPRTAARLGVAYLRALQAQDVLAVGKHFPGHGSSTEDSHLTLPVVTHDRAWMGSHELLPFQAAIGAGIAGIMVGHVSYPGLDPVSDRPASLSPPISTGLLRDELGFQGLVLTDDLGAMQAVTEHFTPGEAAVQAVEAGADVLIISAEVDQQRQMVRALKDARSSGRLSAERIEASARRVLEAKQRLGLLDGSMPVASEPFACSPEALGLLGQTR